MIATNGNRAALLLFRYSSFWRFGNRPALYLLHHVAGNHLEKLLLLRCDLPWFRVENTKRPNRKTIRSAQGNTGIEPEATFFHKWVICEAGISGEVAHDQHLIVSDNVTANGNFAWRGPSFGEIGWQSGLRFEPLSILVDQGHKCYWHSEQFR